MPTPILDGDQYRDDSHDVLMADIINAEATLVNQGINVMQFRIAAFSSAEPGHPLFDVPVPDNCMPSADGTSSLTLMGRLMGSGDPNFQRAGTPTAVQYSVDGETWLWVSDLLGITK